MLFATIDPAKADLTSKQIETIDAIKKEHTAQKVSIVFLQMDVMETAARCFRLSDESKLDIELCDCIVEKRGDATQLVWKTSREKGQSVVLTVRGKSAVGVLDFGYKSYQVRPIGRGVHAIIEVDASKSP